MTDEPFVLEDLVLPVLLGMGRQVYGAAIRERLAEADRETLDHLVRRWSRDHNDHALSDELFSLQEAWSASPPTPEPVKAAEGGA